MNRKYVFKADDLDLWPTTLPIKLDLDMVHIDFHVKFLVRMSNGSVSRAQTHTHTDTHTDGSDSMTSTADAGGKNAPSYIYGWQKML